ncbi:MAG: malectin domain-containing carbohydrate-binding protein, partial [Rhodospirillales bacterium]
PSFIWHYVFAYYGDEALNNEAIIRRLIGHAIAYYQDFIKPRQKHRLPNADEIPALGDLAKKLAAAVDNASGEELQTIVYEVGKNHPKVFPTLKDWFRALYQTERWGMTGYSLPVAPGLYTVKLHFAETFATTAAARVFSVDVEGQKLTDIDVFASVGARTALVRTVPNVVVTDGKLDIGFTNKAGAAIINGIEVQPVLNCQATAQ